MPLFENEKPYEVFGHPNIDSDRMTKIEYCTVDDVPIVDVRDSEDQFNLSGAGFQFLKHHSACCLKADFFEFAGKDKNHTFASSYL